MLNAAIDFIDLLKLIDMKKSMLPLHTSCVLLFLFSVCSAIFGQGSQVNITATGTGRTTGHIATLSVINPNAFPILANSQQFYIPSEGKYQPYIGSFPETTLPPGTSTIPVTGYCADVHTPPVPSGSSMPPIEQWIPVAPTSPISTPPGQNLLPTPAVPSFTPEQIKTITQSSAFKPVKTKPEDNIITTWPGTDIVIGGVAKPGEDPETFAPVLVDAINKITEAYNQIKEEGNVNTPFSADPPKEMDAVIQQTFWIFTSDLSGEEYEKLVFGEKVYEQFEENTGAEVETLPEEQQESLDEGISDFWNTFTAVGVEAKVISDQSPGLDPTVLASVRTPSCACKKISYDLEVKKGGLVVHAQNHSTPDNPRVAIAGFAFNDVLEVKLSNIRAHCKCDEADCLFYPAESTNPNAPSYTNTDETRPGKADVEMENDPAGEVGPKGNNNCQNKNKSFNADGTEYSFTLETRDEGTLSKAVYQKLRIKTYCQLEGCSRRLCAKYIQLNFVTAQ